jgi:hypothetical protein
MSIDKPYHRIVRGLAEHQNAGYSGRAYVVDPKYAERPEHYVRAFLLIQKDLLELFEYIEPADGNLATYSFRIHELLMRTCIEIEANFKAILQENEYNPKDKKGQAISEKNWNIRNYQIVDKSHHLSSYKIYIPTWEGEKSTMAPFLSWKSSGPLTWYQAYNQSKHSRHAEFRKANLENLLNAVAALVVLLSSQFRNQDFTPRSDVLTTNPERPREGEPAIGEFFYVEYPSDWAEIELYSFDWSKLKTQDERFQKFDFDQFDG